MELCLVSHIDLRHHKWDEAIVDIDCFVTRAMALSSAQERTKQAAHRNKNMKLFLHMIDVALTFENITHALHEDRNYDLRNAMNHFLCVQDRTTQKRFFHKLWQYAIITRTTAITTEIKRVVSEEQEL